MKLGLASEIIFSYLHLLLFLNAHPTYKPLQLYKQTLNFFIQPFSSWCQEKCVFFCLCFLASLWHYNPLPFGIYFYRKTGTTSQELLMMAEWTAKSHGSLSLCSSWLLLSFTWFALMFFLSLDIRDLTIAYGSAPISLALFRELLSSSHLLGLVLSVCVCFIFPLYTFFLRRLHPHPWFRRKAQSRVVFSKSSSNSHFVRVVMKVPSLWMCSVCIRTFGPAGYGAAYQPTLDGTTLYSCHVSQSPCAMLSRVFLYFELNIVCALKPALYLYFFPHFLYTRIITEFQNIYFWHSFSPLNGYCLAQNSNESLVDG